MRIGLITYNSNHLKTEQVALGLAQRGYRDLAFYALPFVERPARQIVFAHRPDMASGAHSRSIAAALNSPYRLCETPSDIPSNEVDIFLILGAGLLPADFVQATAGRVVNAHPGIVPVVRGLDAFKWAIYDQMPIGNTLHLIDEEADAGEVLGISPTPVFASDTLESFARRHYELEIAMMIDFERLLGKSRDDAFVDAEPRPARMRMKADIQAELAERFEQFKARFASDADGR